MLLPTLDELTLLHANICQALGDPKRILIVYALHENPRHVMTLAQDLALPQSTVSRHLRTLRQCGLVQTERNGTSILYSLTTPHIIQILDMMRQLMRDTLSQQTNILSS